MTHKKSNMGDGICLECLVTPVVVVKEYRYDLW